MKKGTTCRTLGVRASVVDMAGIAWRRGREWRKRRSVKKIGKKM
jgi:hypothetical protein